MTISPKNRELKAILVDDRMWRSIARDLFSIAVFLAMVGIGWLAGSAALQWVGAILWFLLIFQRTDRQRKSQTMTIAKARQFLDNLELEEKQQDESDGRRIKVHSPENPKPRPIGS